MKIIKKSLFVAPSANAILNKPPQIAAKAIPIMMSCENFISARLDGSIKTPGGLTSIGCSIGAVSVKIEPVGAGILAFANNPWVVGWALRGAERLGAAIIIKSTIFKQALTIDPFI